MTTPYGNEISKRDTISKNKRFLYQDMTYPNPWDWRGAARTAFRVKFPVT